MNVEVIFDADSLDNALDSGGVLTDKSAVGMRGINAL
jgi:hypothetical protein